MINWIPNNIGSEQVAEALNSFTTAEEGDADGIMDGDSDMEEATDGDDQADQILGGLQGMIGGGRIPPEFGPFPGRGGPFRGGRGPRGPIQGGPPQINEAAIAALMAQAEQQGNADEIANAISGLAEQGGFGGQGPRGPRGPRGPGGFGGPFGPRGPGGFGQRPSNNIASLLGQFRGQRGHRGGRGNGNGNGFGGRGRDNNAEAIRELLNQIRAQEAQS